MQLINDSTLSVLKTLKESGYSDRFTRLVRSVGSTSFSYGKSVYTPGLSSVCRFVPKPSPDLLPGANVQVTDAELFFPKEFILLPDDHVLITHIGRKLQLVQEEYEIVAGPVLDSLGKCATLMLFKG